MKRLLAVALFMLFAVSGYAQMATRVYVHKYIAGDPIIDTIEQYDIPVFSTSKQLGQTGSEGIPVIPIVVIRVRGDAAVLNDLDAVLPSNVIKIPRYRGDTLLVDIPQGARNKIINTLVDEGIPLNWFQGCMTWRDFLTRLLKHVHAQAKFPDQIPDDETEN